MKSPVSRARLVAALALLATPLLACPGKAPPRAEGEAARPIRVPKGCERSQAGEYYLAQNPDVRYHGDDDGGTLVLQVLRAEGDGGVSAEGADAGTLTVHLQRTPDGFVGETRAVGYTSTSAPCPVNFPTEVLRCDEESLKLRTVYKVWIDRDNNCQPAPAGSQPPQRLEPVLVRGAPDAGTP